MRVTLLSFGLVTALAGAVYAALRYRKESLRLQRVLGVSEDLRKDAIYQPHTAIHTRQPRIH